MGRPRATCWLARLIACARLQRCYPCQPCVRLTLTDVDTICVDLLLIFPLLPISITTNTAWPCLPLLPEAMLLHCWSTISTTAHSHSHAQAQSVVERSVSSGLKCSQRSFCVLSNIYTPEQFWITEESWNYSLFDFIRHLQQFRITRQRCALFKVCKLV